MKRVSPDDYFPFVSEITKQIWQGAYPQVDVKAEIKKMEIWLRSNPTRWKSNYDRFVCNWLSRNQQEAVLYKRPPTPQRQTSTMDPETERRLNERWKEIQKINLTHDEARDKQGAE